MQATTNLQYTEQYPYQYLDDKTSLLTKYDIPVTHLDFSYVEQCEDKKELEKILHILKSGQEGYYPQLIETVERKLQRLHPKSKFLRYTSRVKTKNELEEEEWKDISEGLDEWIANVSKDNRELENRKGGRISNDTEIRKVPKCESTIKEERKPSKIQSTDYAAWDKYDVDTEILSMDLQEEKLKEKAKKKNLGITKKKVKFCKFATDVENRKEANEEREKGNEYFRAGDYQMALIHYTASVDCFPTIEALNNRAMCNLKLQLYEDAITDCNSALNIDHLNLKANWRKAVALNQLQDFEEALECVETCINIEPNDNEIQNFANSVRKKCKKNYETKKRLIVKEETSSNDLEGSEDGQMRIVPIPGTSRMTEPFYIRCRKNDEKKITSLLGLKSCDQESLYHLLGDVNELYDKSEQQDQFHSTYEDKIIPPRNLLIRQH